MILKIHVPDAPSYDVGDEIWQESLAEAIRAEAEVVAVRSLLEIGHEGVAEGRIRFHPHQRRGLGSGDDGTELGSR